MSAVALPPKRHLTLVDNTWRPRTRSDCASVARPCPYVGCSMNMFLDVDGSRIKLNFPGKEPDEMDPTLSCALDIADHGTVSLEDVGDALNCSRERGRQIETQALAKMRRAALRDGIVDHDELSEKPARQPQAVSRSQSVSRAEEYSEPVDVDADGKPVSFFTGSDEQVCSAVWNMFVKDSNQRGYDARSKHSKAATAWRAAHDTAPRQPPQIPKQEEEPMTTRDEVKAAHAAWTTKHGAPPTARELYDAMGGEAMLGSLQNLRNFVTRSDLPLTVTRGPTATAAPKAATQKPAKPSVAKAPRATSDTTVAVLVAKRDELLRAANALNVAIEALS